MIAARIVGMISRTSVKATKEAAARIVQYLGRGGVDDAEHLEPYGFTSRPKPGAEAVIVNVGADASAPVVIVVADRRYRVTSLQPGEVALHDDQGQSVTLYRDRIEVAAPKVIVNSTNVYLGGAGPAGPLDGLVHGSGVDPFTGLTYAALQSTSAKVAAAK